MGPKKKEVIKKVLLGRPGKSLSMGMVGLPNVGKSTTFNVLSNLQVPAENYPFCTIEPQEARVLLPDKRFDKLVEMYEPLKKAPASITIYDIAGLVRGASEGQGLGNNFLAEISRTDGLYHVVRAFSDKDVIHEEGEVDPIRDMEIILHELIAKDMQHLEKSMEGIEQVIKRKNLKTAKDELEVAIKVKALFEAGKSARDGDWRPAEIEWINTQFFLTAKPVVYLVNIGAKEYLTKKNKHLPAIQQWIKEKCPGPMLPYSAEFEKRVLDSAGSADKEDRDRAAEEMGAPTMVHKICNVGYRALQLIHFFTAGKDEVKCWTVRDGWKAPQCAGTIHGDFERGFICAEVMKFDDLVRLGSENEVKGEGLYKQQGKTYDIADGDICFFKFNVTATKGKVDKTAGK